MRADISLDVGAARSFIAGLDVPRLVERDVHRSEPRYTDDQQAFVVASQAMAFVHGVTPSRRKDINSAALLAQLHANKVVGDSGSVWDWYNAYSDVLYNAGWTQLDRAFNSYQASNQNMKVHEAVLALARQLLGDGSAALSIVISVLEALKKQDESLPWITLFKRETLMLRAAKFQIGLAERNEDGDFVVSRLAFGMESDRSVTQVLFFKFASGSTTLKTCKGRVTINEEVLDSVRDLVLEKIQKHTSSYIKNIDV